MELFPQGRSENGMNEATIVIPNWNGMKYLQGCLDSLRAQTQQNFRILMIDNGSEQLSGDPYPGIPQEYRFLQSGQ